MTYVEQLLLTQAILARQLEPEVPELKNIHIPAPDPAAESEVGEEPVRKAAAAFSEDGLSSDRGADRAYDRAESSLRQTEEALQQLQSARLRAEGMTAGQAIRQVSDSVSTAVRSIAGKNREDAFYAQPVVEMRSSGIAGMETHRSMSEISRFFERDSRRYGG